MKKYLCLFRTSIYKYALELSKRAACNRFLKRKNEMNASRTRTTKAFLVVGFGGFAIELVSKAGFFFALWHDDVAKMSTQASSGKQTEEEEYWNRHPQFEKTLFPYSHAFN